MKSNSALINFLDQNKLNRDQVRTQLKNWKRNKFEYYEEVYETDPIKARQLISSHLPDDHSVF